MKHCIISDVPLTPGVDSRAHIIPSALGGRLKPRGILAAEANTLLNEKFDLPLTQAFQPLMTLLGASRDRGDNRPVRMDDESGHFYEVRFGEPIQLTRPECNMDDLPDGATKVEISARTLAEARTLLGKVRARFPEFDIEEAMQYAAVSQEWPDGMLHTQLEIGPRRVFPATFVAASIFAAYHELAPHADLKQYVSSFDIQSPRMPPDTFYWIPPQPIFRAGGEITHILALMGDAKRKKLLVYAELFNIHSIAVLLPFDADTDIRKTYGVDILKGQNIDVLIDEKMFAELDWTETHRLGHAALYKLTEQRIRRLVGIAQDRARAAKSA
jgi:hypothetical protein